MLTLTFCYVKDTIMKHFNIILLILFFLPNLSNAQESPFYIGLGYGMSDYAGEEQQGVELAANQKIDEKSNFVEIYAGYRFNKYVSFELGYADFDTIRKEYALNPNVMTLLAVNNQEEVNFSRISLGGLIEYSLSQKVNAFVLAGYSYFDLDRKISGGASPFSGGLTNYSSSSEDGIYYGLGIKYRFNEKLLTRLQWVQDNPKNIDIDGYRLSLELAF